VYLPYPVGANCEYGLMVVNVDLPVASTWERRDEQLVRAVREHAAEWERLSEQLTVWIDAGWTLQGHPGVYAARAARSREAPEIVEESAAPGVAVEWCVSDRDDELLAVGGFISGTDAPSQTFPGATLPALVATGAALNYDGTPLPRVAASNRAAVFVRTSAGFGQRTWLGP